MSGALLHLETFHIGHTSGGAPTLPFLNFMPLFLAPPYLPHFISLLGTDPFQILVDCITRMDIPVLACPNELGVPAAPSAVEDPLAG